MNDSGWAAAWLRRLPSPTAIFVGALGVIMFSITVAKGVQDPDYFWHVTAGRLIATTGRVPNVDPFSFTWAAQPWTPHEWLSELLMYRLVSGLGATGALVAFALFGPAIFAVLAFILRRRGVRTLAICLASALGAFVLVPYVTLRPQSVSWLLMAGLLGILLELRPAHRRWSLILVPYFALWANLHGLWVVGLGVVGVYALFTLAGRTPMAPAWRWVLAAGVGALLATMLTPAGPVGVLYPLRYVQPGDWGLANIQEWQSPNFHEPAHLGLLALIVLLGLNGGRAAPGWMAFLSYLGIVMTLLALRNAPLAAVWAVPVLAFGIEARLAGRRHAAVEGSPPRRRPSLALGRRALEIGLGVVVAVAAAFVLLPGSPFAVVTAQTDSYPRPAIDLLERVKPNARVLAEYGWGGYVIYRMYASGGRVFVDGRNDMYPQQILKDYSAIRAADAGWTDLVNRYRVDAMLFPPGVALTKGPATDAGWCEAYRDAVQVLLLRSCPVSPSG